MSCGSHGETRSHALKLDIMAQWIEAEWKPRYPDQDLVTLKEMTDCANNLVLDRFDRALVLPGGYTFASGEPVECAAITQIAEYTDTGELTDLAGAFVYHFVPADSDGTGAEDVVDVLVMASYYSDEGYSVCVACVPAAFMHAWVVFAQKCAGLASALDPTPHVRIIGGRSRSFEPNVDWDDIVLPPDLKAELLRDVESFFSKGIDVYKRLKLKPFRKLLLAGIPGTGKTMLCSALAKWALKREFLVIYVSSADYCGAAFWKIENALSIAASSNLPTLILLEELDAYLREEDDKALVLNVLDGAEAKENEQGSLLIATTNYPEAIDERVLKRPGRLDRVFIIPETRTRDAAEKMLRYYLGEMWRAEHARVAAEMVGYPGAFIREVAIYAMTQAGFDDRDDLPLDLLEESFHRLLDQITAKDDFLTRHRDNGFGFVVAASTS